MQAGFGVKINRSAKRGGEIGFDSEKSQSERPIQIDQQIDIAIT